MYLSVMSHLTLFYITYLEQGRDSISGDTSVGVGDEVLHVKVTSSDRLGLSLSKLVEGLDGRKLEDSFW